MIMTSHHCKTLFIVKENKKVFFISIYAHANSFVNYTIVLYTATAGSALAILSG